MSKKIKARWEWRTFGDNLEKFKGFLDRYEQIRNIESEELYILSRNTQVNCKIRNELLDIKIPLRIDRSYKLEQWTVFDKTGFPLSADKLAAMIQLLRVNMNWLEYDEFSYTAFLESLVNEHEDIRKVKVNKKRAIYQSDQVFLEYSEVYLGESKYDTIAIESADKQGVIKMREQWELNDLENINYLRALKRVLYNYC